MSHEVGRLLLIGVLCLVVLGLAEALHHRLHVGAEWTRKLVHVLMGLLAAAFPWIFDRAAPVALLCAAFAGLLALSRRLGLLLSVHGVARPSLGAVAFPAAVALVFLLAHRQRAVYLASLLVLTLSDALAAVVGTTCGRRVYRLGGDAKSLEGTGAFAASALVCIGVPLLVLTPLSGPECFLVATVVTILATLVEAMAPRGTDNFFVPITVCLALLGLAPPTVRDVPLVVLVVVAGLLSLGAAGAAGPSTLARDRRGS